MAASGGTGASPEMERAGAPEVTHVSEENGVLNGGDSCEGGQVTEGDSLAGRCSEVPSKEAEEEEDGHKYSEEGGGDGEPSGPCTEVGSSDDRNTLERGVEEEGANEEGGVAGDVPEEVLPTQSDHSPDSSSVVCVTAPTSHLQEGMDVCGEEKEIDMAVAAGGGDGGGARQTDPLVAVITPSQDNTTEVSPQVPPPEDVPSQVPPPEDVPPQVPPPEDVPSQVPPPEDVPPQVPPPEDVPPQVPPPEDVPPQVPPPEDVPSQVPPPEDTATPTGGGIQSRDRSPNFATACSSEELTEGVTFAVDYLGSTSILSEESPGRETRYTQTQEAIDLIKQPAGEHQPKYPVALEVSINGVEVRVRDTQEDLMSFPLVSISFVADTNDLLVVMAIKDSTGTPVSKLAPALVGGVKLLKMGCHVFQSPNARTVATTIGDAFQLAYRNFLKQRNITEDVPSGGHSYESILKAQKMMDNELRCIKDKQKTEELVFPKRRGVPLGLMLIESGFGSPIPCCIVAALSRGGAAHQSGMLNVGDHVLALNGVTFVGLPLKSCLWHVQRAKQLELVKMVVVHCPPVAEFRMFRPDAKYPLGFSVKDGLVCSLTRSTIADRCGVRVGHQIIEINGRSVVDTPHEDIVHALTSIIGDIHVKTMPDPIFRVVTGKVAPKYS